MVAKRALNSRYPALKMEGKTISSLPDFAEIFLFLQNLGPYMKLPGINLADLENFFRIGKYVLCNEVSRVVVCAC